MHNINFNVSNTDADLIQKIVERAEAQGILSRGDRMRSVMDITACHANGNPLRLAALLATERRGDFAHDIAGITRHIDRETGKLGDCFSPRFSA